LFYLWWFTAKLREIKFAVIAGVKVAFAGSVAGLAQQIANRLAFVAVFS
jgi:hypothetical protein